MSLFYSLKDDSVCHGGDYPGKSANLSPERWSNLPKITYLVKWQRYDSNPGLRDWNACSEPQFHPQDAAILNGWLDHIVRKAWRGACRPFFLPKIRKAESWWSLWLPCDHWGVKGRFKDLPGAGRTFGNYFTAVLKKWAWAFLSSVFFQNVLSGSEIFSVALFELLKLQHLVFCAHLLWN